MREREDTRYEHQHIKTIDVMVTHMGRTTVTLTEEAEAVVRRMMDERAISFKDAINTAILAGAPPTAMPKPFVQRTFDLGATVPLEKATQLAGELENVELMRKRDLGK
jgi:hypothetical protein